MRRRIWRRLLVPSVRPLEGVSGVTSRAESSVSNHRFQRGLVYRDPQRPVNPRLRPGSTCSASAPVASSNRAKSPFGQVDLNVMGSRIVKERRVRERADIFDLDQPLPDSPNVGSP